MYRQKSKILRSQDVFRRLFIYMFGLVSTNPSYHPEPTCQWQQFCGVNFRLSLQSLFLVGQVFRYNSHVHTHILHYIYMYIDSHPPHQNLPWTLFVGICSKKILFLLLFLCFFTATQASVTALKDSLCILQQ